MRLDKTNRKKLYLQVFYELQAYIRENNLKAGDKLPTEAELCQQFGVSRNVLREAIKSMEITGIVTSKPGVGITICEVNLNFVLSTLISQLDYFNDDIVVQSIEEMRSVLELGFDYAAFSSVTDEDLAVMEEQVRIMESRAKEINTTSKNSLGIIFATADAKFHKVLFSRIKNILVSSIIELFWAYDRYFLRKNDIDFIETTVNKHKNILIALQNRDYTEFHNAMVYHFTHYYEKSDPHAK